ncbi:hypothetical protein KIL84_022936 [Mauremys mutica]|uniref:Uncharacterized protein n=1 Tax=Mauremys mutica TaxID=74926 RepID=A0A9D3WQN8_9SAUR|nr:hypothetical protein KIL84_022936 [Mauremys mutica]
MAAMVTITRGLDSQCYHLYSFYSVLFSPSLADKRGGSDLASDCPSLTPSPLGLASLPSLNEAVGHTVNTCTPHKCLASVIVREQVSPAHSSPNLKWVTSPITRPHSSGPAWHLTFAQPSPHC